MNRNKVILIIVLIVIAVGLVIFFTGRAPSGAPGKVPKRISILTASDLQLTTVEGIRVGLKELGYKEGVDITIEVQNPKGDRDLTKKLAKDMVVSGPDLIVSVSTSASSAVKDANKEAGLAVVFADVGNFKELGIENIQRPGGVMTGVVVDNVPAAPKRMEILKILLPGLKKIAVLANPDHVSYDEIVEAHREGAHKLGVEAVLYDVTKKEEVSAAMARIIKDRPGAFMSTSEAVISGNPDLITPVLAAAKIPSIDFNVERGVSAGYLMVYGISRFDTGKQSSRIIDKVLKGEKPGDIPVEYATQLTFEINGTLAKRMGIAIPDSLLLQANKVYNE